MRAMYMDGRIGSIRGWKVAWLQPALFGQCFYECGARQFSAGKLLSSL
jgi:hypothetical protein